MSLPASKEREQKKRDVKPVPFRNIIYKYFVELLLFTIIIVVLALNRGYNEIILALIGGIVGRITSK